MRNFVLILFLSLMLCSAYALHNRYVFKEPKQEEQFNQLTQELRCLVCQNETLEASNAPLANDIKAKIAKMIQEGQSNELILTYLKTRYGDFIDFKPPLSPRTYLLWFGPFLLLAIGFLIIYFRCCQRKMKLTLGKES